MDVRAGETLKLGTAADPVGTFSLGREDTGFGGAANGELDLATTNPTLAREASLAPRFSAAPS